MFLVIQLLSKVGTIIRFGRLSELWQSKRRAMSKAFKPVFIALQVLNPHLVFLAYAQTVRLGDQLLYMH